MNLWAAYFKIDQKNKLIWSLAEAQNWKCCYCGIDMHKDIYDNNYKDNLATIEHVIRKADGGNRSKNNLVASCAKCNSYRQDEDAIEYSKKEGSKYIENK